jgi:hypothetical protein
MRDRPCLVLLLLLAACGSSGSKARSYAPPEIEPGRRYHVVYHQYRAAHAIFVVENLAGRDLVELRSRVLQPGETPVAYVEDEVMAKMIAEFERLDYYEYARPRPKDPPALGATGELTVTDPNGRRLALLRVKAPEGVTQSPDQVAAAKAYGQCTRTFLAVWEFHRPKMQATTSRGAFGRQS